MDRVSTPKADIRRPPGTERPLAFRPTLRYELIGCGLHGHELCDPWLPLLPPERPSRQHLPPHDEITLPLRGKALRDEYVLRLIAVERFLHFVLIALLAAAVLIFRKNEAALHS
jgi:hypothetical protein